MEDAVVLVVIVDGLVVVAGADRCTLADVLVDVVVDVVASLPVSVTAVAFTCFHVVDSVCPGPVLAEKHSHASHFYRQHCAQRKSAGI